jgi:hypothetical protein
MTHTTLITVNAMLDLLAVLAVFAIVWFTHRLRPRQPIPLHLALPADEAEELSRAA